MSLVNTGSVRYALSTKQDSIMACQDYADISGKWYNELGSRMEIIQCSPADGVFKGVYVNSASGSEVLTEKLVGSLGKGVPATLGFVVNFEDGKYTTTWSGQYRNDGGKEVLKTTWLMTANLENGSQYWESTNVSQDFFTRVPQNPGGRRSLVAQHIK